MSQTAIDTLFAREGSAARYGMSIGEFVGRAVLAWRGLAASMSDARMTALRDAAAVRAMAHRYDQSDRGFASDLYAAADRHEELVQARVARATPAKTAKPSQWLSLNA
jgi:hypothetical protein